MSDQPRRHHLVPRGLLAGFTLPQSPERLWVIDTKRIKLFPANIKDITTDKDFYRITPAEESGDPFAVEKLLGDIESKALPIIRQIDETGHMPMGEDREHLMMFLAILRLRVRFFRSQLDGALSQVLRQTRALQAAEAVRALTTQQKQCAHFGKIRGLKTQAHARNLYPTFGIIEGNPKKKREHQTQHGSPKNKFCQPCKNGIRQFVCPIHNAKANAQKQNVFKQKTFGIAPKFVVGKGGNRTIHRNNRDQCQKPSHHPNN
jgi:hypothetical protein